MIAFAFLLLILSLNTCIAPEPLTNAHYNNLVLNNDDIYHQKSNLDLDAPKYLSVEPTLPQASDAKTQSLRDMLKEMFELIRSPELDNLTIVRRFIKIYQPQYKTEVLNFLRMMGRYSIPQFNHPIFQKQKEVIPILMDVMHLANN